MSSSRVTVIYNIAQHMCHLCIRVPRLTYRACGIQFGIADLALFVHRSTSIVLVRVLHDLCANNFYSTPCTERINKPHSVMHFRTESDSIRRVIPTGTNMIAMTKKIDMTLIGVSMGCQALSRCCLKFVSVDSKGACRNHTSCVKGGYVHGEQNTERLGACILFCAICVCAYLSNQDERCAPCGRRV
jgi:hypothetical protein